jgi:hypothetical protein
MDLMLNDDIDDKVLSEEALKIIQEIMIDPTSSTSPVKLEGIFK